MVERVDLKSGFCWRIFDGDTYVDIIPYGASIRSIVVPDADGTLRDVCLGYDSVLEYATQGGCLGAVVGRYANRISGAAFTLNGKTYRLYNNEGPNTCHGGGFGFHKRWWHSEPQGDNAVICSLDSPDGDEGFPGRMQVEVTYTWKDGALAIDYQATSDADTILNLTNHAYFNLAGQEAGEVGDHILFLRSDRITPIGMDKMVTGETKDVTGTPFDFRQPVALSERWSSPDLAPAKGFDHNYCLEVGDEAVSTLTCPRTGICMETFTDLPGCQVYSAGGLAPRAGKDGAQYGPYHGLCLETQNYPNAVNTPGFPSPILKAGETWKSRTVYRFTVV